MQYKDIIKSPNVSTLVSDSGSNIDEIADEICNVMLQASNIAIPKSRFYSFRKPYWDDTLKELHTNQKNLRIAWMNEGRPRGRHHRSFRLYKEAKALFAKTLKMKEMEYDQKRFENIQNDQELDIRRFWRYVRSHKDFIQVIHNIEKDGIVYSSPEELRKMWKSHFEAFLNDNDDGIDGFDERFKDFIDDQIGSLNISMRKDTDSMGIFEEPFTMEEITSLYSNLPNNKAPGNDLVMYEHLKHGGSALHENIAMLFNQMIKHVCIGTRLKIGLLFPAYKGKMKQKDQENSYRGITLMPALNKLFEKAVWNRVANWPALKKILNPLQMAGRNGGSAMDVSFCVQEAILYHTERGGKVFSCFVDVDKAFDKVWWNGILYTLHLLAIKDKLWHLFREWFVGSTAMVLFDGEVSESFSISRLIKQDGVLSMFLFTVSIMDLHDYVNQTNDGLCVRDICVSSPSYADDITLMSNPSEPFLVLNTLRRRLAQKRGRDVSITSKPLHFGDVNDVLK